MVGEFSEILKVVLQVAQVVALVYAAYKFTRKPHDTLAEKIFIVEKDIGELKGRLDDCKRSLDSSHEKHRQQHDTNEMFITVILSFIDFEIAFCSTTQYKNIDDLLNAKDTLQKYLAKK